MTQFETVQDDSARGLLSFWFEELAFDDWFIQKDDVDARLQSRFGHLVDEAEAGKLDYWRDHPLPMLALILVLDQLPRNLFRGSARAFVLDDRALAAARQYLDQFHDAFMGLSAQQKLNAVKTTVPAFSGVSVMVTSRVFSGVSVTSPLCLFFLAFHLGL